MSENLVYILIYVSAFVPGIPLWIGLRYLDRLGRDRQLLLGLVGFSFFIQVIALAFMFNDQPNNFFFHIYTPIEFILLGSIYKRWLSGWWPQRLFDVIIMVFIGFCLINTLCFQPYNTMNSYAVLGSSFFLMVFAVAFFYRVLNEMSLGLLERSYQFWINASILLYYSGSLLILGLTPHIFTQKYAGLIWIFHSLFNILHYLLFGIGLWIKPQTTNSKS